MDVLNVIQGHPFFTEILRERKQLRIFSSHDALRDIELHTFILTLCLAFLGL